MYFSYGDSLVVFLSACIFPCCSQSGKLNRTSIHHHKRRRLDCRLSVRPVRERHSLERVSSRDYGTLHLSISFEPNQNRDVSFGRRAMREMDLANQHRDSIINYIDNGNTNVDAVLSGNSTLESQYIQEQNELIATNKMFTL